MKLSFKARIISFMLAAAVIPLILVIILTFVQKASVNDLISDEIEILAKANLAQAAQDAYGMAKENYALTGSKELNSHLFDAIHDISVGKEGYVYAMPASGDDRGKLIIHKVATTVGKNIWQSKDNDGNYFAQDQISGAKKAGDGNVYFNYYTWKNEGETVARQKIAACIYFEDYDWVFAAGAYMDEFTSAQVKAADALGKLVLFIFIVSAVMVILISIVAYIFGNQTSAPILFITKTATLLSEGDAKLSGVDTGLFSKYGKRTDEIGRISDAMDGLVDYLQRNAEVADEIAKGNVGVQFEVAGANDILGNAMTTMRDQIQELISDTNLIISAVKEGNLDYRGDLDKFDGAWENMIDGVNQVVDAFVAPLRKIIEILELISKGEIPDNITEEYYGDFNKIKDSINMSIDAINLLVEDTKELVDAALGGERDKRADSSRHGGDFGKIISGINETLNAVIEPIKEASEVLSHMAKGDLSYRVEGVYKGDHAITKNSLNSTLDSLNDILSQVLVAVDQVNSGADQVSSASQSLSQGATEQASSLEEVSSSLTEVGGQTKLNADNAHQASQLSGSARDAADTGNSSMQQMLGAMGEIHNSSTEIEKIIKVIDEIAFQTNLLALNAAVEAARAGVHGKGFAVVAEEVRNLAQRSAKAAKETTELIEGSVNSVENGTKIADETAKALDEIVTGITKATDLVNEISSASREQSNAVSEINDALGQIDQVTQGNTANAEESAAAAEELSGQAANLREMVTRFKLSNDVMMAREIGGATMGATKMLGGDVSSNMVGSSGPVHNDLDDIDFGDF